MKNTNEMRTQLSEIIREKALKTVFQPIVSLKNGSIFGYEALSRITLKRCGLDIRQAFELARETQQLLELEILCRKSTVRAAVDKPSGVRLFMNFDPNILRDHGHKSGVTAEKLEKKDIDYADIVFEADERWADTDREFYRAALNSYRAQGFAVAVDNMRSGYSGINGIPDLNPQYVKLSRDVIRDIDSDEMKRSFVSSLAQLARDAGIAIIATGVETASQLRTLTELKVDYAQGYYLAKPCEKFVKLRPEIKKEIIALSNEYCKIAFSACCMSTVKELCRRNPAIPPDAMFTEVYEFMNDPNVTETAIIDESGRFLGVLTRWQVLRSLSGLYGYTLNMRKTVGDVMDTSCMIVTCETPVETAAKMAMARPQPYIYDSIPVVDGRTNEYCGFVSIKDLLLTAIDIKVNRAKDCNPLTGLPGNIAIDERVEGLIGKNAPFAIIYFDLDNFKAFNDAYGFSNGDLMIKAVAETLTDNCGEGDFCGHVGGDDFVVITLGDRTESFCGEVFAQFDIKARALYSEGDRARGYIIAKNRNGAEEQFPLASLSAAAITNRERSFDSMADLSLVIAQVKKLAKHKAGNSLVIV